MASIGCGQSGSEKRAEVKSISQAVDRLRQAPNAEKAPKLSELSRLPCSLPDVCALRDRCVQAYRLLVDTLDAIHQAKGKLDGESVAGFEKKLEESRKLTHECLENELVVGRRWGTQL